MCTTTTIYGKPFDFASKIGKLYTASGVCDDFRNWAGVPQNINSGDLLLLYKADMEPELENDPLYPPVFVLRFITPTGKTARLWVRYGNELCRFDDLLTPEEKMELNL